MFQMGVSHERHMTARKPRPARGMPDAVNSDWLDKMVRKLFTTLEEQLERVANAGSATRTAAARASDARTLSSLEQTLQRLAGLERERMQLREKKVSKNDTGARAALERRLDKLIAGAAKPSGKSDGG